MTQKLHMETGHPVSRDVKQVDGESIRFVDQDGKCLFEASIYKDQASIEVRTTDFHKVDGVLHDGLLIIRPKAANSIILSTPVY